MALVKYGAGIIQISGAIAGDVHARNRFGNYIRPRTKPVNPHSPRQESIRAVLSYLAEYWHADLNPTQRGLWDTYAAAVSTKNRLSETIHLTGYNHFIRTNCASFTAGFSVFATAPSVLSLPEKDETLICSASNVGAQQLTFTYSNVGWAVNGETKFRLMIYQGQPQLASRNYFNGPWRFLYAADEGQGAAGTVTVSAAFAFAVGQKVWFQGRILTVSGRLSNLWTTPPKTIENGI